MRQEHSRPVALSDTAEAERLATVNFREVVSCFLFIRHSRCACASTSLLQRLLFAQHDLQGLACLLLCEQGALTALEGDVFLINVQS